MPSPQPNKPRCCEKCYDKEMSIPCTDPDCSCHSEPKSDWEKDILNADILRGDSKYLKPNWEERLDEHDFGFVITDKRKKSIKSFITQLLKEEREKLREKIEKEIKPIGTYAYPRVYLEDVLSILNENE